jgi:hypothetical protein
MYVCVCVCVSYIYTMYVCVYVCLCFGLCARIHVDTSAATYACFVSLNSRYDIRMARQSPLTSHTQITLEPPQNMHPSTNDHCEK